MNRTIRYLTDLTIAALILTGCGSDPEPLVGPPGDEQARAWEPIPCEQQCSDGYEVRDLTGETHESIIVRRSCTQVLGGHVDGGRLAVVGREYGTWQDIPDSMLYSQTYVADVRAAAPQCVEFHGTQVNGRVIIGLGVTQVRFVDVDVWGYSPSTSVYYRAESGWISWEGGSIDGSFAARYAAVAVDASNNASFVGVSFVGLGAWSDNVGVEAYRNPGEGGVPRINTSVDGLVARCNWTGIKTGIVFGSREGERSYANEDNLPPSRCADGGSYGSACSDLDHVRDWVVEGAHAGVKFGRSASNITINGRVRP